MQHHFTSTTVTISKRKVIMSINKNVEKLELSYTAGRNVKWCKHFERQSDNSTKQLNIVTT